MGESSVAGEAMRQPQQVLPNPDPSVITTAMIDRAVAGLEEKLNTRLVAIDKATETFHDDLTRVPTLLDRSIQGLRELIEQRLLGMDKDISQIHDSLNMRQASIKEQVTHLHDLLTSDIEKSSTLNSEKSIALREVTMEKFSGVATQFEQLALQMDKAARDVKSAVDAAFAAAKEAVGEQNKSNALSIEKSERAVAKLIDGINDTVKTIIKAVDDKFNDVKERITIIESKTSVTDPTTSIALQQILNDMRSLQTSRDTIRGHSEGSAALWAFIVGGLGLLFGLVGFVSFIMNHVVK